MRKKQRQNGNGGANGNGNDFQEHHIIPTTRGGKKNNGNVQMVPGELHYFYHRLFLNRKPEEIIEFLVSEFWNGQWEHVLSALKRYNVPPALCKEFLGKKFTPPPNRHQSGDITKT